MPSRLFLAGLSRLNCVLRAEVIIQMRFGETRRRKLLVLPGGLRGIRMRRMQPWFSLFRVGSWYFRVN